MSDLYTPEELAVERAKARLPAVITLLDHIDIRERQLAIAVAALNRIYTVPDRQVIDVIERALAAIEQEATR